MLGEQVSNFHIVRVVAEGGMGTVYAAQHTMIGKQVAVKILRPELMVDATIVNRFFNEAKAMSGIRHPNVVEVIDYGLLPNKLPYLVMELLEGEELCVRLQKKGILELETALDFTLQVAAALDAAHRNGVIHRDLKPDNLFLVPDERAPEHELIKVLDFGIAKHRDDKTATSVKTKFGALMGTPTYMSPEQCRGVPEGIDHRSDIYALAITLYEMLCGRPPFVAEGYGDVMVMQMKQDPEPPSTFCQDIPQHVEQAILKALQKNPEDRFESIVAFAAALDPSKPLLQVVRPRTMPGTDPKGLQTRGLQTTVRGGVRPSDPTLAEAAEPVSKERRSSVEPPPKPDVAPIAALASVKPESGASQTNPTVPSHTEGEPAIDLQPTAETQQAPVSRSSERTLPPASRALRTSDLDDPFEERRRKRRRVLVALLFLGGLGIVAVFGLQYWQEFVAPRGTLVSNPIENPVPTDPGAADGVEGATTIAPAGPAPADPTAEPNSNVEPGGHVGPADHGSTSPAESTTTVPGATPRARPPSVSPRKKPKTRNPNSITSGPRSNPSSSVANPSGSAPAKPPNSAGSAKVSSISEPGLLSLDSTPWAYVYLGGKSLGTTPLMRVSLPPGKHVLTLKNPELGASTQYVVTIKPGAKTSRFVGWEK